MLAYILRRVLATIPVMGIVALFVFSLLYIAPGDAAAVIAGDQASPEDVERIRKCHAALADASPGCSCSQLKPGAGCTAMRRCLRMADAR